MAIALNRGTGPRAVIFDLDEALIDSRGAWRYAAEEAVAAITGRRVNAAALVAEYRSRPWRHAMAVLVEHEDEERCAALAGSLLERSALKRLLVHEGVGMALDALRGDAIEVGVVSRAPHALARRHIDSTGLDRFLAVLSATPPGVPFDFAARARDCLAFLGYAPGHCVAVVTTARDAATARAAGLHVVTAGWCVAELEGETTVAQPGELRDALRAR